MQPVTGGRRPWLQAVRHNAPEALAKVYKALLEGKRRPENGHMLKI